MAKTPISLTLTDIRDVRHDGHIDIKWNNTAEIPENPKYDIAHRVLGTDEWTIYQNTSNNFVVLSYDDDTSIEYKVRIDPDGSRDNNGDESVWSEIHTGLPK